jgi:hypothetical protein
MAHDTPTASELLDSRRTILPSWIVSAVVHAAVLLIAGLLWQGAPAIVADQPDRASGIVLRKFTPQGEYFEDAQETFTADQGDPSSSPQSKPWTKLPAEAAPTVDLGGLIPKPPTVGSDALGSEGLGGEGPGVEGDPTKGAGSGFGLREGGKLRTSVYGVYGEGNKFLYVFDRSDSMYGAPLASAKAELIRSLAPLERLDQFGIIFYNHEISVFNPKRLSFGDDASKASAERYIQSITAAGATKHVPALLHALRLSPDVIFLLTDGESHDDPTRDELKQIRAENSGTQIHVIQFVQGAIHARGGGLVQLARENGGEHKFIDADKLK